MDANNTLNNIASQPLYVLIFVGIMAFLFVMHRLSLASAVQAETIKSALSLAATGQLEANRLRDETNKQNDRWLHMQETMNERFIMAITGQTGVITGQAKRLDTMDTSLSSLPKMAAAAEGSDAKTDLIVEAIKQSGADIQAVNRKLGYMALDTKTIAKYLVDPTVPNKDDVQDIANGATGNTPAAPVALPVDTPSPVVAATDSAAAKAAVAAVGAVAAATKTAADAVEAANAETPAVPT